MRDQNLLLTPKPQFLNILFDSDFFSPFVFPIFLANEMNEDMLL